MNPYVEMTKRHEKEVAEFPMFFAFSQEQFNEGMKKLGLEPTEVKKVESIGLGGFVRKCDVEKLDAIFDRQAQELREAIYSDTDGTGFAYEMFRYELSNHEYDVTMDAEPSIRSCGLTVADVAKSDVLTKALKNAARDLIRNVNRVSREKFDE